MTPVRPVLDTNILVSALLFHSGALAWLRGAWRSGRIRPLAGPQTTTELIRVLSYPKFALSDGERQELLDDYLPFCETVAVPEPPPEVPACRDPFDRPFLELALAGRADVLVTGDADLLALANDFSVPIVSPAAFKERLSRDNVSDG
ncbi:MAG: putative toxin-antitoxin system toxin component, PIN family [Rhodospirillales bacterium]|nr:putative toxin-antitoxin system toxin component, PIN family [Rhodospirillales bacterium]